MSKEYVLGIDQGTTSGRIVMFDAHGGTYKTSKQELDSIYPKHSWMEQIPDDYIKIANKNMEEICNQLTAQEIKSIKAIGVTNQRETTILFNKLTGEPVYNAIVWSDARTKELSEELSARPDAEDARQRCGLPMSSYFAALKVRWLLDNNDHAKKIYDEGNLCFATIDTWIIYNLTGGVNGGAYITDSTNATRSMLVNLDTLEYDPVLIKFFGFEKLVLPEIKSCSEVYGHVADGPLKGVPISGCVGDQSAALVGHLGFSPGDAKNTYGTGCFLLYNTGNKAVRSERGLLTTVAFRQKGGEPMYALEGSVAVCGSVTRWLKKMGIVENAFQIGDLAETLKDNDGCYFVTGFNGLFAPYWASEVTGTTFGLGYDSSRAHYCRAAVEAVCYQSRAILDLMIKESGTDFHALQVDGGMSTSNQIMQIQSDILGIDVVRSAMTEPTSMGAAIAAGLAVGFWSDLDDVKSKMAHVHKATTFKSRWSESMREHHFAKWDAAVDAACKFGSAAASIDRKYGKEL